ncbi:uncharacterized protein LOC144903845 [Branchiostoma floridae x Branchiostoma belcheri]
MDAATPKNLKRSGRISMATVMLFMGVAVVMILIQPAASHLPERSLLAIQEDIEDESEETGDSSDGARGDERHVREAIADPRKRQKIKPRCYCVRYCSSRRCVGWWVSRRCNATRYCCQPHCRFGLV